MVEYLLDGESLWTSIENEEAFKEANPEATLAPAKEEVKTPAKEVKMDGDAKSVDAESKTTDTTPGSTDSDSEPTSLASGKHDWLNYNTRQGVSNKPFFDSKEEVAVVQLKEKYPGFKFEESNSMSLGFNVVTITGPNGAKKEIEFNVGGSQMKPEIVESHYEQAYNDLTSFIDTNSTSETDAAHIKASKARIEEYKKYNENMKYTPEQEIAAQEEYSSEDLFKEYEEEVTAYHGSGMDGKYAPKMPSTTKTIKPYEEELEQAKAALIRSGNEEPSLEEVEARARKILVNNDLDSIIKSNTENLLETMEGVQTGYDAISPLRALNLSSNPIPRQKLALAAKEFEVEYNAKLDMLEVGMYELRENGEAESLTSTVAKFEDEDYEFDIIEGEEVVKLNNGKIVPARIVNEHIKAAEAFNDRIEKVKTIQGDVVANSHNIESTNAQLDLLSRSYNSWEERIVETGVGLAEMGAATLYGLSRFSGGQDDMANEAFASFRGHAQSVRDSYAKDVEFHDAFSSISNFGTFAGQELSNQIPVFVALATPGGMGVIGAQSFGNRYGDMYNEEQGPNPKKTSQMEKWFSSAGFAATEVLFESLTTLPLMRNAKKAFLNNPGANQLFGDGIKSYFKNNAARSLVFEPLSEGVSEGLTSLSQNLISGAPLTQGLDHAVFSGLMFGTTLSTTPFMKGLYVSSFSDFETKQVVRGRISEMQELDKFNNRIQRGLDKRGKSGLGDAQDIKDNQAKIQELQKANEVDYAEIEAKVKTLTPKAAKSFFEAQSRLESLRLEAARIIGIEAMPENIKETKLANIKAEFDATQQSIDSFKASDTFNNNWTLFQGNKKNKSEIDRINKLAVAQVKSQGGDTSSSNVSEVARVIYNKEAINKDINKKKSNNKLNNSLTSHETVGETVDYLTKDAEAKIKALDTKEADGANKRAIDKINTELKEAVEAVENGAHGFMHVNSKGQKTAVVNVDNMAKADRLETRTHELQHVLFTDAIGYDSKAYKGLSDQILSWTKENNSDVFKRILANAERRSDGNLKEEEVVAVFFEEVAAGNINLNKKRNSTFAGMLGHLIGVGTKKSIDVDMDLAGETDAIKFLVNLAGRVKNGSLTLADLKKVKSNKIIKEAKKSNSKDSKAATTFSNENTDTANSIKIKKLYEPILTLQEKANPTEADLKMIDRMKADISGQIAMEYRGMAEKIFSRTLANAITEDIRQDLLSNKEDIIAGILYDPGTETAKARTVLGLVMDFDPNKHAHKNVAAYINQFLPERSKEIFAKRGIEETSTKSMTDEKVAMEAENVVDNDVDSRDDSKPKRKGILLSDRFDVRDKMDAAAKDFVTANNLAGKSYKETPSIATDVVGELMGISPAKILNNANLTKGELASAQMFIAKHPELLIAALPEGSNSEGKATGVQKVLLEGLYNKKSIRAKTGAGLNVQVKKPNIKRSDFIERFGIVDGKRSRDDRNTSSRVLALAKQLDRTISNQSIREQLIEQGEGKGLVHALADGKSPVMFSRDGDVTNHVDPKLAIGVSVSNKDIFLNRFDQVLEGIPNGFDPTDLKATRARLKEVYKGTRITTQEINAIAKNIKKYTDRYSDVKTKTSHTKIGDVGQEAYMRAFLLQAVEEDVADRSLIQLFGRLLPNGFTNTTNLYTKDRIVRNRETFISFVRHAKNELGWSDKKILRLIYTQYKGMYTGAGKIGDGSLIKDADGNIIEDPNWNDTKPGKFDGNKWKRNEDGSLKLDKAGKPVTQDFRGQVFGHANDLIDELSNIEGFADIKGKTWNEIAKSRGFDKNTFAEKSKAAMMDLDYKGRLAQAVEAREAVQGLSEFYLSRIKDGTVDHGDLLMLGKMLGSGMSSPMKRAANVAWIGVGVESIPLDKLGQETEYEHMIPTNKMMLEMFKHLVNDGVLPEGFWNNYEVAIIPKVMDKGLIQNGLRDFLPMSLQVEDHIGSPKFEAWRRYYNKQTLGGKGQVAIKSIDPAKKGLVIGEDFVKASNMLVAQDKSHEAQQILGKVVVNYSKEVKGASIWDFDDTLARTKSGVRYKLPNPSGKPQPGRKVIFMAGGAGSGKSGVLKQLGLEGQGFKTVNQDISLEWLKKNAGLPTDMRDLTPEQLSEVNKLAGEARRIAKRKQGKFKGNGDGVVIDGTGGSLNVMKKKVQEFKDAGYDVQMVFVETSLDVAQDRNANRKERSLGSIIVAQNHKAVQGNKEGFKELFGNNFAEVNTDKLAQGEAMPSAFADKVNKFTSGYINARLDAGQFAHVGADLLAQGATFDFSEFSLVKDGSQGPLFQEALSRAKKYGTKDQFVLTARPMAAAPHIQQFLKEQGLDIPIENITGLESSSADSKALWIAEKIGEGYNDIYFADDHLANVNAVSKMLSQYDVKGKVVQAKVLFSKDAEGHFNEILERVTGVKEYKEFSGAAARLRGSNKGRNKFFVPPSAEDFKGLIYSFLGKGKDGDADMAWFKKHLLDPFSRGIKALNATKQLMSNEYKALRKQFPSVVKGLNKKVGDTDFTLDAAIRVYLWDASGFEVPGLSNTDKAALLNHMANDPEARAFADVLGKISRRKDGYIKPGEYWVVETIAADLHNVVTKVNRAEFLAEWNENVGLVFSEKNLNKIEAVYGTVFREALENILFRMRTGSNRATGQDKLVSKFTDWINGSVGAVMFFNTRSAVLQTLSVVNFIDWKDNNLFKAAGAFANQKQYWTDFGTLFNSDMLKQRRAGMEIDVSISELTEAVNGANDKAKAALRYLLQIGFTPTQVADSFAIAAGGSTFYRNKVKKYVKEGMSKEDAESKAFNDFQEIAEETQQSSRPDMISQQQSGVLGRIILAWQNTPMQYTRLTKKAISDLANGRGDWRSHVSRILYYGLIQNVIFGSLQSGLAFMMFSGEDEEEEKQKKELRVANGALDTILRGTGIYGAMAATLKNTIMKYYEQKEKGYGRQDLSAIGLELISLSPPISSKIRKIVSAAKTYLYNEDVIDKMSANIDNPMYNVVGSIIEGATNIPLNRVVKKLNNLDEALNGGHALWQRVALVLGWDKWSLGTKDADVEKARAEVKEDKAEAAVERREVKKAENKKIKEDEAKAVEAKKKASGVKEVRCSGTKSNGERCSLTVETKAKTVKCSYHKSYGPKEASDTDGDGVKEYQCTSKTGSGNRCKNRTENTNKKCYAHQ